MRVVLMSLAAVMFAFPVASRAGSSATPPTVAKDRTGDFCDSLLSLLIRFFPDSVKQARIAVYPVLNRTSDPSITGGTWVSEYLIRQLRKNGRFVVVDRTAYRRGLRERDMGPRDLVDDSTAQALSAGFGAAYLLTGTITTSPLAGYKLEGRIVDARSGIIVSGAAVNVSLAQLDALGEKLISQRMKSLITPAMLRSMVAPGWGQFFRNRPVFGSLFLAGFWGLAGADVYCFVKWVQAYQKDSDFAVYLDYSPQYYSDLDEYANELGRPLPDTTIEAEFAEMKERQGDRIHEDAVRKLATVGGLSAAAACVYALNLIDVAVTGRRWAHEYRLYFTGDLVNSAGIVVSLEF